jgi:putative endonuclease
MRRQYFCIYGRFDLVFNLEMNLPHWILRWFISKPEPEHLRRGRIGELAAKKYLQRQGMKFLAANFRSERGEIDLIFREPGKKRLAKMFIRNGTDCLVFAEVKTRSSEDWTRPAAAVDAGKRQRLSLCALDYLRRLGNPRVKFRFDIVEVLLEEGRVAQVRHVPNAFALSGPLRYADGPT